MKRWREIFSGNAAVWLLASVVALCAAVLSVWWGSLNQDEGWYLYAARLVSEGKMPYRDFFFTQGPALPIVYSALPVKGLLSGRLVTLMFSLSATAAAIAFARRLVTADKRSLVSLTVFSMLACNLYHVYFTTIPKTYALGAASAMIGFLLLSRGWYFSAALAMAFSSGTRISLVLMLGVVGIWLMATRFRDFSWLRFGLGGATGLFLVYGLFAMDPSSLKGLLAAQAYHAGRGGFDPFFVAGSFCRLVRGYQALGAVLFAAAAFRLCRRRDVSAVDSAPQIRGMLWMTGLSFAAVLLLQMSAPFPYDDYEVPIMPLLAVLVSVFFVNSVSGVSAAKWFPVLTAGMCALSSPMLQEWMTNGHDRFWVLKKDASELAQVREAARRIEALDPGGTDLLTQDLYLAVEAGRKVPAGLEMGPFSYFPSMDDREAAAIHVLNSGRMEKLLESAPCAVAALSGYAFAIEVPKGTRTPRQDVDRYRKIVEKHYRSAGSMENFGQNHTRLDLFVRRDAE